MKLMTVLFGMTLSLGAFAGEMVQIEGLGKVPYEELFRAESAEGETKDHFVARVSPQLIDFSNRTGFEACGVIAHKNGQYSIIVGTNQSQVACANFMGKVISGYAPTDDTLHSHGNGGAKLNRTDMRFLGIKEDARSKRMFGTVYGQDRHQFSEVDLRGGAGYLATPDGVLHQDGKGKVRKVR